MNLKGIIVDIILSLEFLETYINNSRIYKLKIFKETYIIYFILFLTE